MSDEQVIPAEDAEEGGDVSGEEMEDQDDSGPSIPEKKAKPTITGRGVTLQMLIADNIIQPGEGVLSLDYLGQKFTADLLTNGNIKSNETGQTFVTPSSWAIFCKNLVNPGKRSGCGWSTVKYKGRKLDTWKTSWFRQMKPRKPNIPGALSPARSIASDVSDSISESESKLSELTSRSESLTTQQPKTDSTTSSSKQENITQESKAEKSSPEQTEEKNLVKTDSSASLVKNDVSLPLPSVDSTPSMIRTDSNTSLTGSSINSSFLKNDSSSSLFRNESNTSLLRNESGSSLFRNESGSSLFRNESGSSLFRNESGSSLLRNDSGSSLLRSEGSMPMFRSDNNFSMLKTGGNLSLLGTSPQAVKSETMGSEDVLDLTTKPKVDKPEETKSKEKPKSDICFVGMQEEALNLSLKAPPPQIPVPMATPATVSTAPPEEVVEEKRPEIDFSKRIERKAITYEDLVDLTPNIDQNILIECESFEELAKTQPYTVSMSTNSLLVMDFHCHLTSSEVVGYLGGKWDSVTQHLSIQQAFPCKCRLGDTYSAANVEEEIRASMKHMSMSLVGWYHSHPYCLPEPSVKDIDCQMSYQLRMKNAKSTYFPCVGIINSPYFGDSLQTAAAIQMYMVMPPPYNLKTDFGIPMELKYSVKQNHSICAELLCEIKDLVDFYRGAPDWIAFKNTWQPGMTYLDKLKASLSIKLPVDQIDQGSFLDFVNEVLFSVLPSLPPIPNLTS